MRCYVAGYMDKAFRKIKGVSQPSDDWKIHDYLREERELTEVYKCDQNREFDRSSTSVYIIRLFSANLNC